MAKQVPDVWLFNPDQVATVTYTNWKGETAKRRIVPIGPPRFGSTEHHPEEQWLLPVYDVDKKAERVFAMKDTVWH